jgi:prepilin-type N-terminal cleavage/methylation domain-containing protein
MRCRRGLSLVEVVIAIVILGLAVPPLMFQMAAGVQQQEAVLIQQNLTQLASERMWEVYADHADPTRGYDYIDDDAYADETDPWGLAGYARQTTIREVSSSDYVTPQPGSGIKRFLVLVTGPESRSLTVEAFVADVPGATGPS